MRELAAVLLDKVLFLLAVQTHHGTGAAAQAKAMQHPSGPTPESDLAYLLWGDGAYAGTGHAALALAMARNYPLPQIIVDIGADRPAALWSVTREPGARHVLHRTPHTALAAALDYHPGQPDAAARVWRATLPGGTPIYTQHPFYPGESDHAALGEASLPRVAQWHDTLIALYRLPPDDPVGGVRVYFPLPEMDAYQIDSHWCFAQQGAGYVAVYASDGLQPVTTGRDGHRAFWSWGNDQVWLCLLGNADRDKSFEHFIERVRGLSVTAHGLGVRINTLRGDSLAVGWATPFTVNDAPALPDDNLHISNPYCTATQGADIIEIRHGEDGLRLNFSQ